MTVKEVVDDTRKKKGPLEKIMKERMSEAEAEYQSTKIRRLVAEEEARIRALKREGRPIERGLATDFSTHIFQLAEVDPKKAKEFLSSLDEESMNKIAYLMAMEKDRAGAFLNLAKSSGTSTKDLIEIMKFMRSNGSVDLKGIAEIFKAGVEAAKANRPQGPGSFQEGYKYIHDTFVKPFTDALRESEKKTFQVQLKAIEDKIPPPLQAQIASIKQTAAGLGLTEAGKRGEVDLKIEEMRQSHDLDMEKLRWEQQKFVMQQSAERDKWSAVSQMLSPITAMAGPEIRNQLRNLGREVTKSSPAGSPQGSPMKGQMAKFVCPSCHTELKIPLDQVPPEAKEVPIKCPKCGVVTSATFQKEATPATSPPEEKPTGRHRLTYKMG